MSNPPFDLPTAERWFAAQLNNQTWDLVEAESRTTEQTEAMLHSAHAAYWHWSQVGQPINRLRALVLLATAYGKAELSEGAVRYADQCLACLEPLGDEPALFDQA
jgi:hypothetical protein